LASRKEDPDATRAKLLKAASQVFAEQGFHAATVREICASAKVNVAAINYHFRDKLGLYSEVLRQSIATSDHASMREAVKKCKSPEDALQLMISSMLQRMYTGEDGGWSMRIVAHEFAKPSPALPHVIEEVMRPNYQVMRGILGRILDLDPEDRTTRLYAHSVIGQIVHYALARPVIERLWPEFEWTPKSLEKVADHISEFTLDSLKKKVKRKHK
jgi:AcrR family transcriptional regulator